MEKVVKSNQKATDRQLYSQKHWKNASVTIATKLTPRQARQLDWLAHDNGLSRYELTRRVLIAALALDDR